MTAFYRIIASATVATLAVLSVAARAEVARFDPKTKTYCIRTEMTGSILPQRICASRRQWIDRGATIVARASNPITQVAIR